MTLNPGCLRLDLDARHVNAGRAIALAPLAGNAQIQGLTDVLACEASLAKLPGQRQPQGVRTSARHVLFVAGYTVTGAHRASVKLATMAVVVAHLDCLGEPFGRIATRARRRLVAGERIALHVPGRPVHHRLDRNDPVIRLVSEIARVVHARRLNDFVRIEPVVGIEQRLDLCERLVQARAVLPGHPLAPAQTIAVLAGKRALVFTHHGRGFLGDCTHLGRAIATHVEDRSHVQRANAGVRIPGSLCAIPVEHFGQPVRVIGQVFKRHRAILNERDGLAVAAHAHHDVQAGLAHLPQGLLLRGARHVDHRARQSQIRHQLREARKRLDLHIAVFTGEFDEQDRLRMTDQRALDDRPERRVIHGEVDHRAVDQLHRARIEFHDVLRERHRFVKRREIDDPQRLVCGNRQQIQRDVAAECKRAFRADQQVREVRIAIIGVSTRILAIEDIDVVACDPAQYLGHALHDLVAFAHSDFAHAGQ